MKPIYGQEWSTNQVRYFLRRWYEYDQHINELSDFDKQCVIQLYVRLSYLTEDERQLLAEQFHKPVDQIPTDQAQAKVKGIDFKAYIRIRSELFRRLRTYRQKPFNRDKVYKDLKGLIS